METYHGHVRTPADAIILFEACRLGLLPRVQRRLSEKERQSIKSGSVFVWDEREAGMRRWTDGKSWSASRVSGSFLTYREMEGKRGGGSAFAPSAASRAGKTPESTRGSGSDVEMDEDGPDGYRYKPDGLMKQSFSITTSTSQHLHLISYYARSHPTAQGMSQPTNDPALRHIRPQKGMYPESTVHETQIVPAVTRGQMLGSAYAQASQPLPQQGPPGYARPPYAQYQIQPMTGYAVHQHQPGYHWPPSPLSTPPQHHAPGPYSSMPPNGNSSPLQYSSQPPPSSGPPAYDRSAANETNRPPPPLPPPHQRGAPGVQQQSPYLSNSSPRTAQTALLPQYAPSSQSGASAPLSSKIDPRLISPLSNPPLTQSSNGTGSPSHGSATLDVNPVRDPGQSANTIPSIGSMMNGAPPSTATENSDSKSEQSGSRQSSRSPGGTKKATGPTDIPSEKLGFGEDKRALRQLDRVFKA